MHEDRTPTCPKCGYSLIGLRSSVCPECGTPANPAEILARSDDTIRRKIWQMQNAVLTSAIGVLSIPFLIYMMMCLPLVIVPGILLIFGAVQALSLLVWRVSSHGRSVIATARDWERQVFTRWLIATILVCSLSPLGVLLTIAMWG